MKSILCGLLAVIGFADLASAQKPEGVGRGGRPSFDKLLQAFDENQDGALSEEEVPERVWMRLSLADADGSGTVSRDEFDAVRKPGTSH
jgi:Ca2+-binding EF-hand superfamily protein